MYIVIYNRFTRRIIKIIPKADIDNGITYGYSDNCAEMVVDQIPEGKTI